MTRKQENTVRLFSNLQKLGFTYAEGCQLLRIERTLSNWSVAECNGDIERNEDTGKPERVSRAYLNGYTNERRAWPVTDREAGALRRLEAIMAPHKRRLIAYHQGDPRGCALYIVRRRDVPKLDRAQWLTSDCTDKSNAAFRRAQAAQVQQYYSRGLAVCA